MSWLRRLEQQRDEHGRATSIFGPGLRVVLRGDPLEHAEKIACSERARHGNDRRVRCNPVTFVTLTIRYPSLLYLTARDRIFQAVRSTQLRSEVEGSLCRPGTGQGLEDTLRQRIRR